jgi:hypothetical protein
VLGITGGELLVNTGGILFVEGEHDRLILTDQFSQELDEARVRILRLHGVNNIRSVAAAEVVLDVLVDLPVAVMVDNAKLTGSRARTSPRTAEE